MKAARLEEALSIKAEFWMKFQMAYAIDKIRIKNKKATSRAFSSYPMHPMT